MITFTVLHRRYQFDVSTDPEEIKAQLFTMNKTLGEELSLSSTISIRDFIKDPYLPFAGSLPEDMKNQAYRYVNKFIKLKAIW